MEFQERRKGTKAVPDDLHQLLSEKQSAKFQNLELHGWKCKFIRRPLFQRPVCIMTNSNETQLAVIEEDGTLIINSDIQMR
jgi:hypothetical protein